MSISLDWLDGNHTIIHYRFEGRWSIGELADASARAWGMMETVSHKVDVIMDLTHASDLPSGFLPFGRRVVENRPQNAGMLVIVGGTPLMRIMASIFERIYGKLRFKLGFVASLEEAQYYIHQHQNQA